MNNEELKKDEKIVNILEKVILILLSLFVLLACIVLVYALKSPCA